MSPFKLRRRTFYSLLFIAAAWAVGFLWFVFQVLDYTRSAASGNASLPAKADVAVVLTGGGDRLETGLSLVASGRVDKMFVSGAGNNVRLADIIAQSSKAKQYKVDDTKVVLGHQAENTIGNAEETLSWLQTGKYETVYLVTSGYHMPRSLLEFANLNPQKELCTTGPNMQGVCGTMTQFTFVPMPVASGEFKAGQWWSDANSRALLLSEYNKYLAAHLRHFFVAQQD
jgi:uncharacterized SAM-binding protein YcdF (DUF218 family)